MIGVDSNVLLRLFVERETGQGRRALALVEKARGARSVVHIPFVVVVDTLWVLARTYRFAKPVRVAVLEEILENTVFEVERRETVLTALAMWRTGTADFADYLIALAARDAGAVTTFTFDTDAAGAPGFTLVPA